MMLELWNTVKAACRANSNASSVMGWLRVFLFLVVGASIGWMNASVGVEHGALVWNSVLGGLGGVAAVDVYLHILRKRSARNSAEDQQPSRRQPSDED